MLLNDVLLHAYSIGRVRNLAVLRKVGGLHMKQGGTGWDLEGFSFMVQNCRCLGLQLVGRAGSGLRKGWQP